MPIRLPVFKPRPANIKAPAAPIGEAEAKAERKRFYNSAAWLRLRAMHLREFPLCERCQADGRLVEATVAHHRVDRLADPSLSYDPANLESLCASHHGSHHHQGRGNRWERDA